MTIPTRLLLAMCVAGLTAFSGTGPSAGPPIKPQLS